jgi:hypothetical protein
MCGTLHAGVVTAYPARGFSQLFRGNASVARLQTWRTRRKQLDAPFAALFAQHQPFALPKHSVESGCCPGLQGRLCGGLGSPAPSARRASNRVPRLSRNHTIVAGHYAGNRSDSRHAVDIRDLVLCCPWRGLILDGVSFRDLEDGWIRFRAIKLCNFGSPSARTWIAVYRVQGDFQLR